MRKEEVGSVVSSGGRRSEGCLEREVEEDHLSFFFLHRWLRSSLHGELLCWWYTTSKGLIGGNNDAGDDELSIDLIL